MVYLLIYTQYLRLLSLEVNLRHFEPNPRILQPPAHFQNDRFKKAVSFQQWHRRLGGYEVECHRLGYSSMATTRRPF